MGYYSTLMDPGCITKSKKRIAFFNKIAKEVESGDDLTKSKYKKFYEKLAETYIKTANLSQPNNKTPLQMLQEDDSRHFFFYELNDEGYLNLEDSTLKHYAADLLATVLAYVADEKLTLKFIGENLETWEYVIDPVRHTATYLGYWDEAPHKNVIALAIAAGGDFVPRTTPDVFLDILKIKTFENQEQAQQWIKKSKEKAKKQELNLYYKIVVVKN